MTKLRRFSLTAYQAPLCETIVDCIRGVGARALGKPAISWPSVKASVRPSRTSSVLPSRSAPLAAVQASLDDLRAGRVVGRVILVT